MSLTRSTNVRTVVGSSIRHWVCAWSDCIHTLVETEQYYLTQTVIRLGGKYFTAKATNLKRISPNFLYFDTVEITSNSE